MHQHVEDTDRYSQRLTVPYGDRAGVKKMKTKRKTQDWNEWKIEYQNLFLIGKVLWSGWTGGGVGLGLATEHTIQWW